MPGAIVCPSDRISLQSATHSAQIYTPLGPAMTRRVCSRSLPQNEHSYGRVLRAMCCPFRWMSTWVVILSITRSGADTRRAHPMLMLAITSSGVSSDTRQHRRGRQAYCACLTILG